MFDKEGNVVCDDPVIVGMDRNVAHNQQRHSGEQDDVNYAISNIYITSTVSYVVYWVLYYTMHTKLLRK